MKYRTLAERTLATTDIVKTVVGYESCLSTLAHVQGVLKPPSGANILLANPTYTERFVFDSNPGAVMKEMQKAGAITTKLMLKYVRLPTDKCWIEYTHPDGDATGVLIQNNPKRKEWLVIVVIDGNGISPTPALVLEFSPYQEAILQGGGHIATRVLYQAIPVESTRQVSDTLSLIFCSLFLIAVPRVCDFKVAQSPPIRVPHTDREYPPISYKRTTITIGVGKTRYQKQQRGESDEAYTRRLHHVVGHFRTYLKGRDEPLMSWVPEHWRGDREKGIILREQHLRPPPEKVV